MRVLAAAAARRSGASWGIADQGLSSLTNLALNLLVARRAGPLGFGAFTLAYQTYILLLGVLRSFSSQPLVIRYSKSGDDERHYGARAATGVAILIGFSSGMLALVVAALTQGAVRSSFGALGLVLPGLLLQDTWRFVFFANNKGKKAFGNDAVWTLVLAPLIVLTYFAGWRSPGALVLIWGIAGNAAALAGVLQSSLLPAPHMARRWWKEQHSLSWTLLGDFAAIGGTGQLVVYAITGVAGLATVGALRAGQVLLGPLNVIFTGVQLSEVPAGVRALGESRSRLLKKCRELSIGLASLALVWTALVLALPESVGTAILGETWHAARPVVLPWGIYMIGLGGTAGASIGLRATAAVGRSLRVRGIMSIPTIVAAMVGTALAGGSGAAWGLAVVLWIESAQLWRQFNIEMR